MFPCYCLCSRMCQCELRYRAVGGNSSSPSVVETFLPPRRTVVLDRLACQTEYCVVFQCRDLEERKHSSNIISLTTGQTNTKRQKNGSVLAIFRMISLQL